MQLQRQAASGKATMKYTQNDGPPGAKSPVMLNIPDVKARGINSIPMALSPFTRFASIMLSKPVIDEAKLSTRFFDPDSRRDTSIKSSSAILLVAWPG
jgi:hypothetical protein